MWAENVGAMVAGEASTEAGSGIAGAREAAPTDFKKFRLSMVTI